MPVILEDLPGRLQLSVTSRYGFVAPPGYAFGSYDYKSQEIVVAANESQDQIMLRSLAEKEELPLLDPDGNPIYKDEKQVFYANPDADLHTITCATCCFPQYFRDKPRHEWVAIAKGTYRGKNKLRDYAKRVNFGILYMATAQSISELNYVKVEEAEGWVKGHKNTYKEFHRWAEEIALISNATGQVTNKTGRIRWVAEDNSKAQGASPARSGVNFKIQSLSADLTKLALWRIYQKIKGTKNKLCIQVHDEIIVVIPGQLKINPSKCKYDKGLFKPVYEPDEELSYWSNEIKQCMIDAETELLDGFPGAASDDVSYYWAH